ncbi:MAG: hypothetical protein JSS81_30100 [Acidobacteria bacterium]|nr:hypothetical protein [Acidobacteriota bacterium]
MRFPFVLFILAFLFVHLVPGQTSPRRQRMDELNRIVEQLKILRAERKTVNDRLIEILLRLKAVDPADTAAAEKLGAKAVRLFPCCALDEKIGEMNLDDDDLPFEVLVQLRMPVPGGFSEFMITDLFRKPDDTMIEWPGTFDYDGNSLKITELGRSPGFWFDLGKVELESVDERTKEVAALAEYKPPAEVENIKPTFFANGFAFGRSVPATVGHTYLLRAVKYAYPEGGLDAIVAVRIHRQDANGSIILFLKPVKTFDPPKLRNPAYEKRIAISNLGVAARMKEEFEARGFNDIEVEVTGNQVVTLKGAVPFGKKEEVLAIAKKLAEFSKINDELTEK